MSSHPRRALEEVIRSHLERGRCVIQFSGGRDSSLVLAVAVYVARRDGLDLPRVVTVRYPGYSASDETRWQERVIAHLGIPLEVIVCPRFGNEIAGPLGTSMLRRLGPRYPPPAAMNLGRLTPYVRNCVVLTGEGGDNILGAEKVTGLRAHWRQRVWPDRARARELFEQSAPSRVRRHVIRRRLQMDPPVPWLTPYAHEVVITELANDESDQFWDWREATWAFLNSRMWNGGDTLTNIASEQGFAVAHPLAHPVFVEVLCRFIGPLGFRDRTTAMGELAADLLPEDVLRRHSKASFNEVYAGELVRQFAGSWDGQGVDRGLVDVAALRRAWQAPVIAPHSLVPLQDAILASWAEGWRPTPIDDEVVG